jgi:hypothetical protein
MELFERAERVARARADYASYTKDRKYRFVHTKSDSELQFLTSRTNCRNNDCVSPPIWKLNVRRCPAATRLRCPISIDPTELLQVQEWSKEELIEHLDIALERANRGIRKLKNPSSLLRLWIDKLRVSIDPTLVCSLKEVSSDTRASFRNFDQSIDTDIVFDDEPLEPENLEYLDQYTIPEDSSVRDFAINTQG